MIQEILGCSWIKRDFIKLNKEELLERIKIEENLRFYCRGICQILNQDDFFFTSADFVEKIRTIVHELRFFAHHDKELVANFNQMLEAVHKYQEMSKIEKYEISLNWVKKEKQARKLPFRNIYPYSTTVLYTLIERDYEHLSMLLTRSLTEYNGFCILNVINLVCSNYPELFQTNFFLLQSSIYYCSETKIMKYPVSAMAKETEKNIEKVIGKDSSKGIRVYQIKFPEQKD